MLEVVSDIFSRLFSETKRKRPSSRHSDSTSPPPLPERPKPDEYMDGK